MKLINKKAFTLIELLVVIAVVGILVLLGAPRFLGYSQKAEVTRIQHDVKVMEQEVGTMLINKDDEFNKWKNNSKDFIQLTQENKLFEKEGAVKKVEDLSIDNTYKVIPENFSKEINTKLKGTFYADSGGKVYYEHGKSINPEEKRSVYSDEEIQDLIENEYIPIATAEELNSIRDTSPRTYGEGTKWEKEYPGGIGNKYVQVANINLSGYSEEGWAPIGTNSSGESFTGAYDGGNYVITGLEVKGKGKDFQGLFGYTEGATIRNVELIGNKVTGNQRVGGLVGYAGGSTKISNSYATGSVKGTGTWSVGGLVGRAENSTIENSYATGSVTGVNQVGGLVGHAHYSAKISNSYATGSVTGTGDRVGGLVGFADESSTVTNSYWNRQTTGKDTSAGQAESFGKTTKEMKLKGTYEGWDFKETWKIDEGKDYPKLR